MDASGLESGRDLERRRKERREAGVDEGNVERKWEESGFRDNLQKG